MQTTTLPASSPRAAVRRESLTDQTVRAIREAIFDGAYALGQKLPESELVARFNVSSSVIREALHQLQGEGIVVTKPYCGRSVFSLRPEEGAELTAIRASLESYAAYLAAQKMTPDMAERIRAAAARFLAGAPDSYGDWVDRELTFHSTVWEASRNDWLIRQLNQCAVPIFALRVLGRRGGDVQSLWRTSQSRETQRNPHGHQMLARSIASGTPAQARRTMLLHILWSPGRAESEIFNLSPDGA